MTRANPLLWVDVGAVRQEQCSDSIPLSWFVVRADKAEKLWKAKVFLQLWECSYLSAPHPGGTDNTHYFAGDLFLGKQCPAESPSGTDGRGQGSSARSHRDTALLQPHCRAELVLLQFQMWQLRQAGVGSSATTDNSSHQRWHYSTLLLQDLISPKNKGILQNARLKVTL